MAANVHLHSRMIPVTALDPVADAWAATVSTDVINASNAKAVHFIVHKGVGATGTSTITIEACDDVTPTTATAIGGWTYSKVTATGTTDVATAAPARATSTGFLTTAGSGQIYSISVDADLLASLGYKFVRLKAVESVDSPVLLGVLALVETNTPCAIPATVIA